MAYATIQDYIDCYGEEELICLTDKRQPRTQEVDITRAQCMLDRACAEIDTSLACCCFDLKKIKGLIAEGSSFPILHHWNLAVARYLLHDQLCRSDGEHEVSIRYKDYEQEIKELCECGILTDNLGNICCVSKPFASVVSKESCLPDKLCGCCGKSRCCCAGFR